jgi:tetratricopeptide (TPR) repeat protein
MKRPSSYKPTFFDRHGPAGELRLKAIGHAIMVFGTVFGAAFLAGSIAGVNMFKPLALVMTLVGALTLSAIAFFGSSALASAAGTAARAFTAGTSSTPYEEQFSQEQALVMQRDYAGALELFEQRILLAPNEPRVRLAAADLYGTHGANPQRAAELYREVQRIPEVKSGQDIYASNKLADLYLGPLKEPKRALVEFRRLIERYPGSTAADHARMALDNLKTDLMKEQPTPR